MSKTALYLQHAHAITIKVRDKFEPTDNKAASAKSIANSPGKPPQAGGVPPQGQQETHETGELDSEARPEDVYELLCNDVVLPITMTIGAVR